MSQQPIKVWVVNTVSRYGRVLTAITCLQMACGGLISLQPRYFQKLVSLVVNQSPTDLLENGLPLITILFGIYLALAGLQAATGYLGCSFSSDLLQHLQIDFFKKLSQLPLQFFERQSSAEFFTKFNHDIGNTQSFLANFVPTAVREGITGLAVTGILFFFCPTSLTIVALCIVVLTAILVVWFNRILAGYASKTRTGWSNINKIFDETVRSIDTLKMFGAEKRRLRMFRKQSSAFRDLSVRAGTVVAVFSPSIELLGKLGSLLLVFLAYVLIAKGDIGSEPFLLFFFYAALLQTSVSNLVTSLANLQTELTGMRNVANFFSEINEKEEILHSSAKIQQSVSVQINDLTFGYPGGRKLYQATNLFLPANGVTLIQGPSGSGKSTLINILLKFHSPQSGSITYAGIDIGRYSRLELRNRIGVVTQNHAIFNESLRDNMQVAKADADDTEIEKALVQAQLGDFLSRMPAGLSEILDPCGKTMSAGEKQRLCIARLLLKNSPLLILDEPLSNIDQGAREKIVRVVNGLRSQTTIVIMTHDWFPSLVVDRVYRLDTISGRFVKEAPDAAPAPKKS